jgi:hypothetical protein
MYEIGVYIPCPFHFESYGIKEVNECIYAAVVQRVEKTIAKGRCI